jgi:peptide/nickel transport system substrate-binding protein
MLAEAGFPNGFDAGDYYCDGSYANLGEAVLDNLLAVGIRAKLRPLERPGAGGSTEAVIRRTRDIGRP